MGKDTQCRKWQITINNPADKGFTHEKIAELLHEFKPLVYFCLADEIGADTHTPHTHIFAVFASGIRFSTIRNKIPFAHIEPAQGTSQENRDYITKSGKWSDSEKAETRVEGSFKEWGELPVEQPGVRSDLAELYEKIKDGASDYELLEGNPDNMKMLQYIEKTRQIIRMEEFKDTFRHMEVTYIYGATGTGKTRYIMEKFGYENIYRVTDYSHPFDYYKREDVLLLEEYRGQFRISDILNYLDGYPISLPCRYANRQACYTKVYIVSNLPLKDQYPAIQAEQPATWAALLRRVHHIVKFPLPLQEDKAAGQTVLDDFVEITDIDNPFDK